LANNILIATAALKAKRNALQAQVDNLTTAISALTGIVPQKKRKTLSKAVDYAARTAKRKATLAAKKTAAGASLGEAAAD
jgi:hypothetical protein